MQGFSNAPTRDDYQPDNINEENLPFRLGELVMCRYSSYPYWPATIAQTHQRKLEGHFWSFRQTRTGQKVLSFWCAFLNEDAGGWVRHDRIVHYHPEIVDKGRLDREEEYFSEQRDALLVASKAYKAQPRQNAAPRTIPVDYGMLSLLDGPEDLVIEDEDNVEEEPRIEPQRELDGSNDDDKVNVLAPDERHSPEEVGTRRKLRAKKNSAKWARATVLNPTIAKKVISKQKTSSEQKGVLGRQSATSAGTVWAVRLRKRANTSAKASSIAQAAPSEEDSDRDSDRDREEDSDRDIESVTIRGHGRGVDNDEDQRESPAGIRGTQVSTGANVKRAENTVDTASDSRFGDGGGFAQEIGEGGKNDAQAKREEQVKMIEQIEQENASLRRCNEELNKKFDVLIHFSSPKFPEHVPRELPPSETFRSVPTTSEEFAATMKLLNTLFNKLKGVVTDANHMRDEAEKLKLRLQEEYKEAFKNIVKDEASAVAVEAEIIEVLVKLMRMRVDLPDLRTHKAGNVVRAVGKACKELPTISRACSYIYDSWKKLVLKNMQEQPGTACEGDQSKAGSSNSSTPHHGSNGEEHEMGTEMNDKADDDTKESGEDGGR